MMLGEMSGFLFLCLCLLFGLCSYFRFHVLSWLGCAKKLPAATGQQMEETDQTPTEENDSEASVSEYQVFLSFRGPDSRQGLADVLYNDMISAGIHVFRDDDELEIGDKISKIIPILENSKICVPVFSRTFAASAWCLREVERMVELGKKIVPIFYTANPDDVKLSTGLFEKDLRKHEKKYGREQVKKWEGALRAVARIKGREVKDTRFAEFSKSFVRAMLIKLKVKRKYVTDYLVKIDDQEQAVMKLLDVDGNDLRLVGIHGMGGIGKTTLTKVIFNQLSPRFDCCSFLENVQESLRCNGLDYFPRQLLEDLDPKLKYFQRLDYIMILRENFRNKKVLIVLDDVNKREEIETITRTLGWFGSGSRIIITTRDRRVFTKETRAFEMQEMNEDQALQLFSRHAFGVDSPPSDYQILTNEVLSLTGRLPLALEVIGSRLYQCQEKVWQATIKKLKKVPDRDIQKKLRISVDALEYEQKQIFLDISCFYINTEKSNAICMWEACDFFPDDGIEVLVSMSLVKITWDGKFWMHDLIRDLGRDLVRDECVTDPAKRSRIWSQKEALEVLKIKQGKKKVEGLFLEKPCDDNMTNEEFSSFRYLRLLKLVETKLAGDFQHLLPKLMWFSWHRCSADFRVTNLLSENLVVLDLSMSFVNENWAGWSLIQMARNLKVLDLTKCFNLTSTPDLSNNSDLERLILRGCSNLAKMHSSIHTLKRLKHLDLEGCYSLKWLPEELGSLADLEVILVEGSGNTFHLPESIGNLHSLSIIKLRRVEMTRIPDSIGRLLNLTHLSIENCTVVNKLPDVIGELKSLINLNLCQTKLSALPRSIGRLVKLQKLDLGYTKIEELPDTVGDLEALVELNLLQTKLSVLPKSIGRLLKLEKLHLGSTVIDELPDEIGDLESLVYLDLACTKVTVLPNSVGRLDKLEYLTLYSTWIKELPDAIGDLQSLVDLNLSFTKELSVLPRSVGRLVKLRTLSLESSKVEELPDSLKDLESLEQLQLSSSGLRVLPDFVGDLSSLKRLQLDRCKIRKLPSSIEKLTRLAELSAESCEDLSEIPKEIGSLTGLRELRLTDSIGSVPKLSPTVNQLSHLQELKIAVCDDSSSESDVCQSTFQGFKNLTDSVRLKLKIDCSCVKHIPQLPSNLFELELRHVTTETRLPDFSNLMNLEIIEFYYCSLNHKLASMRALQALKELIVFSCTKELIEFSSQLENLKEMTIVESSEKVLDLPRSISLTHLSVRDCNELYEIRGLGKLESLYFLRICDCPSLEMVGNFSQSKRLHVVRMISCPKLREIEGLDSLFLEDISIHHCGSLRNIDALKNRCQRGYLNGLQVENHTDEGEESSKGGITLRGLELYLKLFAEKEQKYNQNQASEAGGSLHTGGYTSPGTTSARMQDYQELPTQQIQGDENLSNLGLHHFPAADTRSIDVGDWKAESSQRNIHSEQPGPSNRFEDHLEELRKCIAQLQQQQEALQQLMTQQQQQHVYAMSSMMQTLCQIIQHVFPQASASAPHQSMFDLDGSNARLYQQPPVRDPAGEGQQAEDEPDND